MKSPLFSSTAVVFALGLMLAACADYAGDYGQDAGSDAASDAGRDGHSDGDTSVSDAGGPFCSGTAKIEIEGRLYQPTAVTSERLVMNCCDGIIIMFHLSDAGHDDIVVFLQFYGASIPTGEHDFPTEEYMPNVTYGSEGQERTLAGNLRVSGSDVADDPLLFSLCAEDAEDADSLRLWVDRLPLMAWESWQAFGIYLLDDPEISAFEAADMPLDSLTLYHQPLIDLMSLAYYDGQTHTMALGGWRSVGYVINQLPEIPVGGVPFVVVVDDQPLYLGTFFSMFSSQIFPYPVIVIDQAGDSGNTLTIERAYPVGLAPDSPDPRSDSRILDLMESCGKLKR